LAPTWTSHVARRTSHVFLWLLLTSLLLSGCGRKGALVPPEALVPAAVTDLACEQRGDRFLVSWTPPSREVGGRPLREPVGFLLYRRQVLPAGEDCEQCPDAYRLVREVPAGAPGGVRRSGGRYYVDDTDLSVGTTYQYRLASVKQDGATSPPSNLVRRRFVPAPSPPAALHLTASATAIELRWEAPALPANATLLGYNIYRRRADEPLPLRPLTATPIDTPRYEDPQLERETAYHYAVRSVVRSGGEVVESPASAEAAGSLAPPE
jgi:predicted small lipoprotein YifL